MGLQKFHVGDVVDVVHLPKSMRHFRKGRAVIGEVSHNSCQEGTDWEWDYKLVWLNEHYPHHRTSWYSNSNLRLVSGMTLRGWLSSRK